MELKLNLRIVQLCDDQAWVLGRKEAVEGVPPVPEHPGEYLALHLGRVATTFHVWVQLPRDGGGCGGLCCW